MHILYILQNDVLVDLLCRPLQAEFFNSVFNSV